MPPNRLTTSQVLAANVNAIIDARGLNGYKLAEMSGLSKSSVYDYLTGNTKWPADAVEAVATALKVDPGTLMARDVRTVA